MDESMDEYMFSLHRPDGRQRAWRRVGEQFADGWATNTGAQVERYRDQSPRPTVAPLFHNHHLVV